MSHTFDRPIKRVAIIGAGASGCPAARHLRDAGLAVRVFERQAVTGGIWNWSTEVVPPLSIPTPPPSRAAFFPTAQEPGSRILKPPSQNARHELAPPNPVYWNLSNNVPTSTMAFKDFAYPPGTEENIPHYELAGYIHRYAQRFGLEELISFNTRVESATKSPEGGWRLRLRKLHGPDSHLVETVWDESFDALVVATGHYNAPFIPDIPGLTDYASSHSVIHSTAHRVPEVYSGKRVMIVGIGTSGVDIAKDLSPYAERVYMVGNSIRGPEQYQAQRKSQRQRIPDNGELLPEISRFDGDYIELVDGRVLHDVDTVILATGYQYSFPFLQALHDDRESATHTPKTLVTDGRGVYNLYRDVFYVPDPTLAFIGLSVNTSAFSFFEYQSLSIARVFAGTAGLPDQRGRRAAYADWIAERGEGKFSHLMGADREQLYVRQVVEWLNRDAAWSGAPLVEGHSEAWLAAARLFKAKLAARYASGREIEEVPELQPQKGEAPRLQPAIIAVS